MKDKVLLAGVKVENRALKTNGGRVLLVIKEARNEAYNNIEGVEFEGKYFINDMVLV